VLICYRVRDRRSVHQIQRLHQADVAAPLALAACLALGPAEQIEEAAFAEARVGKLLGGEILRQFLHEWLRAGCDVQRVEQLFRGQTARRRVREVDLVVAVPFVRMETELIRARIYDGADEMPQI